MMEFWKLFLVQVILTGLVGVTLADYCCSFDDSTCGWGNTGAGQWQWSKEAGEPNPLPPDFTTDVTNAMYVQYATVENGTIPTAEFSSNSIVVNDGDLISIDLYLHQVIYDGKPRPVLSFEDNFGRSTVITSTWSPGWVSSQRILCGTSGRPCCDPFPCLGRFRVTGNLASINEVVGFDNFMINKCPITTTSTTTTTPTTTTPTTTTPTTTTPTTTTPTTTTPTTTTPTTTTPTTTTPTTTTPTTTTPTTTTPTTTTPTTTTEAPTEEPTDAPTEEPTDEPTDAPTEEPTDEPTDAPTEEPTDEPTDAPTEKPTDEPTDAPTEEPTNATTEEPTDAPTEEPTDAPTDAPTEQPTDAPTEEPTDAPTEEPTDAPTEEPTDAPTEEPTTTTPAPPTPSSFCCTFETSICDWTVNGWTWSYDGTPDWNGEWKGLTPFNHSGQYMWTQNDDAAQLISTTINNVNEGTVFTLSYYGYTEVRDVTNSIYIYFRSHKDDKTSVKIINILNDSKGKWVSLNIACSGNTVCCDSYPCNGELIIESSVGLGKTLFAVDNIQSSDYCTDSGACCKFENGDMCHLINVNAQTWEWSGAVKPDTSYLPSFTSDGDYLWYQQIGKEDGANANPTIQTEEVKVYPNSTFELNVFIDNVGNNPLTVSFISGSKKTILDFFTDTYQVWKNVELQCQSIHGSCCSGSSSCEGYLEITASISQLSPQQTAFYAIDNLQVDESCPTF